MKIKNPQMRKVKSLSTLSTNKVFAEKCHLIILKMLERFQQYSLTKL